MNPAVDHWGRAGIRYPSGYRNEISIQGQSFDFSSTKGYESELTLRMRYNICGFLEVGDPQIIQVHVHGWVFNGKTTEFLVPSSLRNTFNSRSKDHILWGYSDIPLHKPQKQAFYMVGTCNKSVPEMAIDQRSPQRFPNHRDSDGFSPPSRGRPLSRTRLR